MQGVASGPGKITTFKIIFTLQMVPAMFEVNSDAVNIDFNFLFPFFLCLGSNVN